MIDAPGRPCPLRYRCGPQAIAAAPEKTVRTLYVIGGLYGNLEALDAVERMAAQEPHPVTVCFTGDFNWFNVDSAGFDGVNRRVLAHDAIQGNVEAELGVDGDAAGCGCAYPDTVDAGTVERSNRIHARLKHTAQQHPALQARLSALPMVARYRVGDCRVGVVHGDAESLAGWGFDPAALRDPAQQPWLSSLFAQAGVDAFASTHTCSPALRLGKGAMGSGLVINNGAAGMPNLTGSVAGLITRIGVDVSPHASVYGTRCQQAHVDALWVPYDAARWHARSLSNWPAGTDAHTSYFGRIEGRVSLDAACAVLDAEAAKT